MNDEKQIFPECEEFEILIDGYVDGEIMPDEKSRLEGHLKTCNGCREYLKDTTLLIEKIAYLPKSAELAPDFKNALWQNIEKNHGRKPDGYSLDNKSNDAAVTGLMQQSFFRKYRTGIAAVTALFVVAIAIITISRFMKDKELVQNDKLKTDINLVNYWKVTNVKGTPAVNDIASKTPDSIAIGQWITTNDSSSADLLVSNIGRVTVGPNSKVKIVKSVTGEHRIQVLYGTIDANIEADPRSFFVDMPSVTAVDLGCAYQITVDTTGNGLLYVKQGKVSLEAAGRESLVPEGKFCMTKKDFGPGTPFRSDASKELKKALVDFDFGNCAGTCVNIILKHAKKTDAVTLVSMLPKVDADMKGKVYAMVSGFVSPPRRIPADSIPYMNNPEALEQWIEKIQEEMQSKIEKSMEEMQSNMEKMNSDMNGKGWDEWSKQMDKFGEEFGKEMGKEFDKNYRWHKSPKPKVEGEVPGIEETPETQEYFDKEQFKRDMEEMKKDMEEMKKDFDNEQFKKEMEQSKEEMKRSNKELKNAMKEMKKNLKGQLDSIPELKFKYEYKYDENFDPENKNDAPETPKTPEPEIRSVPPVERNDK